MELFIHEIEHVYLNQKYFSFGSKSGRSSRGSSQRGSLRASALIQRRKEKRKSLKEKEDLRRTKTFRKIEAELTEKVGAIRKTALIDGNDSVPIRTFVCSETTKEEGKG